MNEAAPAGSSESEAARDFHDLLLSFMTRGWDGPPVDAVRLPSGDVVTMGNARLAVAREIGIDIKAIIHSAVETIRPVPLRTRFADPWSGEPKTWGEAAQNRIDAQGVKWATENPNGGESMG